MNVRECVIDSFNAIEADNGIVAVSVFPELGAKLGSLRDLRTQREWLWRSSRVALERHPWGVSYIEHADCGGWDECFPTVAPCLYPLGSAPKSVPDHGDLWSQQWFTELEQDGGHVQIRSRCAAVTVPCAFSRIITLRSNEASLGLAYEVRNLGTEDVAFIWSAHPLFQLQPGMRIEFPATARFNLYSAAGATRVPQRADLLWPFAVTGPAGEIALDPLPNREAEIAFKIWSNPLDEGWARLVADDGSLEFRFDVREIPQIALWLNAGGWSGIGGEAYYNFALEPCIGAQDSLEEAVHQHNLYALLRAGESRSWNLLVDLARRERQ